MGAASSTSRISDSFIRSHRASLGIVPERFYRTSLLERHSRASFGADALSHRFARHLPIVKVDSISAEDLVCLVTLAGDQYKVALARLGDCPVDRLAPVGQLQVRLAGAGESQFDLGDD